MPLKGLPSFCDMAMGFLGGLSLIQTISRHLGSFGPGLA